MCADNVIGFCRLLDRETLLNEIMTSIEDLVSDTSQHVRAALGLQISGLAPILGKEEYLLHRATAVFVVNMALELLHIYFQCFCRCSKTNFQMFGSI